jgi:excisionase family DNA binding protein
MSELLTLEEAAAKVKVKSRTLHGWLQKGKLGGVKVGKQWRVPAENLEAFIRPATAEPFRMREPEDLSPTEQAPLVDCAAILLALVKALLPEGERVYLRDKGIVELPLGALNAILEPQGYTIHAAKGRERRREVACAGRDGQMERFGLFELRTTKE